MKVQLLSTDRGMKSGSLKRIAKELSLRLGYKVFRVTAVNPHRKQFRYGHQVNKLDQYQWMKDKGLSTFDFTTDAGIAQTWVNAGDTVFGRQTLVGSNGAGIVIFSRTKEGDKKNIIPCAVYTKYKKKKREFRVHIFKDKVVGIVEKRKKGDWDGPSDSRVRNLANGYVFCQEVDLPAALKKRIEDIALKARKITKSDFAGIDLGYNEHNDDLFVIEVNSAPGIEGTNVQRYCDTILAN